MKYLAKLTTFMLAMMLCFEAYSMSLFRSIRDRNNDPAPPSNQTPAPQPAPQPAPSPNPAPNPTPQPPRGPSDPVGNFDIFNEVAFPVGSSVDQYFSNYSELLPQRDDQESHRVDTCEAGLEGQNSFADRIAFYVHKHTKPTRAHIAHLARFYNIPSNLSAHKEISLYSQPMCRVTSSTLASTIGSSRVPGSSTIALLNQFVNKFNDLREKTLDGDNEAEVEINQLMTRFMSCLAYTESLTTADNSSSQRAAQKYAPSGYRKPAGVKFYEDPLQDEASRLNIGLFQFTPTGSGNVNPCLRQWNEFNPSCSVATNSPRSELIRVFGSPQQSMNAFCGVNKLMQTFAIQVNTTSTRNTHPDNYAGGMKPQEQRCVTPFFYSGWAYQHFGPLMNSTGKNMNSLMTCVMR